MNKDELLEFIGSNITQNTSGSITGEMMRSILLSLAEDMYSFKEFTVGAEQIKLMGSSPIDILEGVENSYYDYFGVIEKLESQNMYLEFPGSDLNTLRVGNIYNFTNISHNFPRAESPVVAHFSSINARSATTFPSLNTENIVQEMPLGLGVQLTTDSTVDPLAEQSFDGTFKIKIWSKIINIG